MWTPVNHPVEDYFTLVFDQVLSPVIAARAKATAQRELLLEPICYTINVTPGRKFRSALPTALSGFRRPTILIAAAIEILWAAYTILDDLLDGQRSRYGSGAAWTKYGPGRAAYSLPVAFGLVKELFSEASMSNQQCRDLAGSLEVSYYAQLDHATWNLTSASVVEYVDLAHRKVQFVTALWSAALSASGCDSLAALASSMHRETAIGGQIKNDLYNIWPVGDHRGQCSDILDGSVTYPIIRFRELAHKEDFDAFLLYWKSGAPFLSPKDLERLRTLFDRYGILEQCKVQISAFAERAMRMICENSLGESLRHLLFGWLNLQLEHDIGLNSADLWRKTSGGTFPAVPQGDRGTP